MVLIKRKIAVITTDSPDIATVQNLANTQQNQTAAITVAGILVAQMAVELLAYGSIFTSATPTQTNEATQPESGTLSNFQIAGWRTLTTSITTKLLQLGALWMKSTGRDRHHIAQFTQFGLLALSAIANPWGTAGAFAFGSIGAVLASSAVAELSTSHQARQTAAALGGFAGGYFGFQLGTMGTTLTASTSVTSFASRKLDALSDMNFSEPGSETDTALATVGVTPSGIPTPTETATTIPVSASESDTGLESWSITSSQIPTADESATQLVSSTGSETTTFATTQSGLPAPSPDPTTTDVPSSALSASQRPSALPSPSAVMVRRQSESPISDKTEAILTGLLGGGVPVLFGGYLYFRDDSRRSGFINSVTNLPQAILVCFRHRTVIRHLERQVATVTEQRDQAVHNLAEVERERDLASMDLQIASRDLQIIKQERESDIAFTRLLKVMEERDAAIADAARIRTEYEAMQLKLKEGIADLDRRFPQFAPPNPATNEQQTQSNGK